KGVTVYQSSLDDGGSKLKLNAYPLQGAGSDKVVPLQATVGQTTELPLSDAQGQPEKLNIEVTGLRVINVENLAPGAEPQPKAMFDHVASVTGSAAGAKNEHLRNVGPSVQYRIVGRDGQSHEYNNYMLPIELDGFPVFLAG